MSSVGVTFGKPEVSLANWKLLLQFTFLTQTFTNGACFRFLIEQICHITLAVVRHYRGNLADFLHAILLAPFIYIMIPLGEK